MKVDATHPLYQGLQEKRNDFAAVKGGTDSMRKAGEKYLPCYPGESDTTYQKRLKAATIDGLVAMGVDSLCGKVFDDEINTDGVTLDKTWLEDFDNEGTHFNNFARKAFEYSFDGFSLIVADMPPETDMLKEARTVRGLEADKIFKIRPFCRIYTAETVINWHYETNPTTQVKELTLLVLKEKSDVLVNKFERECVIRYRVYSLVNGVVTWELWREKTKDGKTEFILDACGIVSNVSQIPASFVGCVTDEPKLLTESRLEIKAYQKESSFDILEYLSIPTFYTKGDVGEQTLALGADSWLKLPVDGDVGYATLDANGHESLKSTIAQIKDAIKQRLSQAAETQSRAVDKTATETVSENKDKQARLVVWADELHDALERALQFMGQLAGMGDDAAGEIELQTTWHKAAQMAEEMKAQTMPVNPPMDKKEMVN